MEDTTKETIRQVEMAWKRGRDFGVAMTLIIALPLYLFIVALAIIK